MAKDDKAAAPKFRRVEVVANVASGSVGPTAPDEIQAIFDEVGIDAHVCAPSTDDLTNCLKAAVDSKPDLLVTLAGDGTARAAAELCGPDGPMLAPLAGGTMNMLPYAVYGVRPWQEALRAALADGEEQMLGGGHVEGHMFLCSAILGSPALFAPAREAIRYGRRKLAFLRMQKAVKRAFTGRLRYMLDDGPREKAEALVFMCPAVSRALHHDADALEAAAFDPRNAADLLRLGWNAMISDWRKDPAVEVEECKLARIWSAQGVPAILDGETVRLGQMSEVRYEPRVVRVLATPKGD